MMPTLYLVKAGLAEGIKPLIDIASDVEVGMSASLTGWVLKHFRSSGICALLIPSLCFVHGCEHERLRAAAPNSEACNRARFEYTICFSNLISWTVNELKHQVGHIATKP